MNNLILVEIECIKRSHDGENNLDRRLVNAWFRQSDRKACIAGECDRWFPFDEEGNALDEHGYFAGLYCARIIGEIDESKHMEADRILEVFASTKGEKS